MLRLAGHRVPIEDQLQASAADTLNRIDVQSFASPEEFEAAIAALKGG